MNVTSASTFTSVFDVFALVPQWVQDQSAWVTWVGGVFVLVASMWGTAKLVARGSNRAIDALFDAKVPAIIEEMVPGIVEAAVQPIKDEQARVYADLREHMSTELDRFDQVAATMGSHIVKDRESFRQVNDQRESDRVEAREDRHTVMLMLSNIQAGQAPHVPAVLADPTFIAEAAKKKASE